MATMLDVAKRADVSKTTVSHVINGNKFVSEDIKKRVLEAIRDLDYKPNKTAQSLARNSTMCIGLFGPDQDTIRSHVFFSEIMAGVLSVGKAQNYNLIVYTEEKDDNGNFCITLDHGEPIDGAIIINPRDVNDYLKKVIEKTIPFILVGRPNGLEHLVSYVDIDNVAIGYNATRYLLTNNHSKILMLNGPEDYTVSLDRLEGYKIALDEYKLPFNEKLVLNVEFNLKAAVQGFKKYLLEDGIGFTAIIANSDALAICATKVISEIGYRIPKDISLVCAGETILTVEQNPGITGIDTDPFEMGRQAAITLLDVINRNLIKPSHKIIPFKFNARDTVIPLK